MRRAAIRMSGERGEHQSRDMPRGGVSHPSPWSHSEVLATRQPGKMRVRCRCDRRASLWRPRRFQMGGRGSALDLRFVLGGSISCGPLALLAEHRTITRRALSWRPGRRLPDRHLDAVAFGGARSALVSHSRLGLPRPDRRSLPGLGLESGSVLGTHPCPRDRWDGPLGRRETPAICAVAGQAGMAESPVRTWEASLPALEAHGHRAPADGGQGAGPCYLHG